MLASPADLEDFAIGFSLTEGQIARPDDIAELEIVAARQRHRGPHVARPAAGRAVLAAAGRILGPTGCGLCGVDSLEAALPAMPAGRAPGRSSPSPRSTAAVAALRAGAGAQRRRPRPARRRLLAPGAGLVAVREDVGRHNALDKLAGALARARRDGAGGVVRADQPRSRSRWCRRRRRSARRSSWRSRRRPRWRSAPRRPPASPWSRVARDDGFEVFTHGDRIALDGAERTARRAAG